MSIRPDNTGPWKKISLGTDKLRQFFIQHLDHVYLAKQHLISKLPMMANQAQFSDLKSAIIDTISTVEKQLARLELIYTLMDEVVSDRQMYGLTGLINDAFESILEYADEPELRDLSILFYLQNIESLEMSSFQILQMTAVKFDKQILKLLKENYDDAKAGRTLFLLLSSKYIIS